jgi:hypothetical protein
VPGDRGETFFRPQQLACERLTIPATLYNRCRLALARCAQPHVFVPLRSLQVMAVIDAGEVIFVDSMAYAVQDGEGGKLICLAWCFGPAAGRDDLSAPAPIELRYYREDARQLHGRLVGELGQELERLLARQSAQDCPPRTRRVVNLKSPEVSR